MTQTEIEILRSFLADTQTSNVVFKYIKDTYEREDVGREVHSLAAKMIAVELLNKTRKDMETLVKKTEIVDKERVQRGL